MTALDDAIIATIPELSDTPDVPRDLRALAEAVVARFAAGATVAGGSGATTNAGAATYVTFPPGVFQPGKPIHVAVTPDTSTISAGNPGPVAPLLWGVSNTQFGVITFALIGGTWQGFNCPFTWVAVQAP